MYKNTYHTLTPHRHPWLSATKPSGDGRSTATAASAGGLGQAWTDQTGEGGEGVWGPPEGDKGGEEDSEEHDKSNYV